MDLNNGSAPKPRTICEKLSVAIQTATPIRTTWFSPHRDAAVTFATSPNVSLKSPPQLKDRCLRVVSNQSITPSDHNEGQQSTQVPVIFDTAQFANGADQEKSGSVQAYRQGNSGAKSMNGEFSEYIDRAGRKIRSPTIVGGGKVSRKYDSFNDKVSDFIDKTRHRFRMPSNVGVSKIASEEQLGAQERWLK